MQLLGQLKETINLFLLLLVISHERFRGLQNTFLSTVEELKQRFFLHYTNHPQSHQEALKYLRLEKCLISKEKSAIVKQLQKLINLNYEELTSMDAPQNKVIVEEELGQDDNPEDKGIVFIDGGSKSYSNYDT